MERVSRPRRVSPIERALQAVRAQEDPEGLTVKFINSEKGSGLYSEKKIFKGDFICQYPGETRDAADVQDGIYVFTIEHQGKKYCIDAASLVDRAGRYANDEWRSPNSVMKKMIFESVPILCLFAIKDIDNGEEILYDYNSPTAPWRLKNAGKSYDREATVSTAVSSETDLSENSGLTLNQSDDQTLATEALETVPETLAIDTNLPYQDGVDEVDVSTLMEDSNHGLATAPELTSNRQEHELNQDQEPTVRLIQGDKAVEAYHPPSETTRETESSVDSERFDCEEMIEQDKTGSIAGQSTFSPATLAMRELQFKLEALQRECDLLKRQKAKRVFSSSESSDEEESSHESISQQQQRKRKRVLPIFSSDSESESDSIGASITVPNVHSSPLQGTRRDKSSEAEGMSQKNSSSNIQLAVAKKTDDGKRVYGKLQSCYFCKETKMHRIKKHLIAKHSEETEVAKMLSEPKEMQEITCNYIKNLGNFNHNLDVLSSGKGQLIPVRRSNNPGAAADYTPCIACYGFFHRRDLWRHYEKCPMRKTMKSGGSSLSLLTKSTMLLQGGLHADLQIMTLENVRQPTAEFKAHCLVPMQKDETYDALIKDKLILHFGFIIYDRLGPKRSADIRIRMRQVARLKLAICEQKPIEQFSEVINAASFDMVIDAARELSGYGRNEEGIAVMQTPSLGLRLGHHVLKCAHLLKGAAIRSKDNVQRYDCLDFIDLHQCDWENKVSSVSLASLKVNHFNKLKILPVTTDILRLREHLEKRMQELSTELKEAPTLETWRNLSRVTMTRILLFNKRRSNEVAQLRRSSFQNRPNWVEGVNEEIKKSLLPMELQMFDRLEMMETIGKGNKVVPVLLTKDMLQAVKVLEVTRDEVGVKESNTFLFANTKDKHVDAWQTLNSLAKEAKCEKPELISSSRLRKYLATVTQILHLEDVELEWLSRHLAHTITTHKTHYRQHDAAIEIAKIGRLVMAVDCGKASQFSGKSLDQIDVSDMDVPLNDEEEREQYEENENGEDTYQDLGADDDIDSKLLGDAKSAEVEDDGPNGKQMRSKYTRQDIQVLMQHFDEMIKQGRYPRKEQLERFKRKHPSFKTRTNVNIRSKLQYEMKKRKIKE